MPCWGSFHFPVQCSRHCRQWNDCNVEKQQMEMDGMVLTLSVLLCACERQRWEQTWALDTLILYFSMAALTWSSVISHDLRREFLGVIWWPLQHRTGSCRLLLGEQEAAGWLQPRVHRGGAEVPGWAEARGFFIWTEKNKSKFLCRAGEEFSAIKCDSCRIQSFHGKLSLSTEEFRCFPWEKWGEMVWTNWPWSELFPLMGRPEPVSGRHHSTGTTGTSRTAAWADSKHTQPHLLLQLPGSALHRAEHEQIFQTVALSCWHG